MVRSPPEYSERARRRVCRSAICQPASGNAKLILVRCSSQGHRLARIPSTENSKLHPSRVLSAPAGQRGRAAAAVILAFGGSVHRHRHPGVPGIVDYCSAPGCCRTAASPSKPWLPGTLSPAGHRRPADRPGPVTPAAADRRVGVVHVMERLQPHQGHLPRRTPWCSSSAASALITGQSGGREGPAIHLGAASPACSARRFKLPNNSMRTLVACGSAAAIAGSFNTPSPASSSPWRW